MAGYITRGLLSKLGFRSEPTQKALDVHHTENRIANGTHFVHPVLGNYPRLCRLTDGSLLLSYAAPRHGERILTVVRSTDNGHSFEPHGVVARSPGDCDNLFLAELSGEGDRNSGGESPPIILAAFRNHDLNASGDHTFFRITICQSKNGGRDWEYLSQAYEKPAPFGLWEPFIRIGNLGEIQVYFSQDLEAEDQDTMLVVSKDRGRSWSPPVSVTGMGERLRDGMIGIAETRDEGRDALVMVFETTRHDRNFSIECVISFDDGATFGSRHEVFRPSAGRNAEAPQITSFADGSLAVVFMTDDKSGVDGWPGNAEIKAVFAAAPIHGKIRWTQVHHVSDSVSFWPGILRVRE